MVDAVSQDGGEAFPAVTKLAAHGFKDRNVSEGTAGDPRHYPKC